MWMTRQPNSSSTVSMVAVAGALPAVAMRTSRSPVVTTSVSSWWVTSRFSTVGAPHMNVTSWSRTRRNVPSGSKVRWQTWVPPVPVMA